MSQIEPPAGPPGPPPARRRPRRKSRWMRLPRWARLSISIFSLVLLVIMVTGGVVAWKLNGAYHKLTSLTPNESAAGTDLAARIKTSDAPITALVIGSDHRATTGKDRGLSDTLMLVRIDPKHHMASLLSIPRDLWVSIPGYGPAKINGAYTAGGDPLSLKAVKAVTGVHPNYLLNVDFSGFRDIVNALGGVYINVDQHYYNPPTIAPSSGYSEIDIKPGYQLLAGADALAFSRYRHTDDDFHREARQQLFLKAFETRASTKFKGITSMSITDLPEINNLIDAVSSNVRVIGPGGAPSASTLISFVATVYAARAHVASIHANWDEAIENDGEQAVSITPANLQAAINQWKHPWTVATAGSSIPKTTPKTPAKAPWKPAVSPVGVNVVVKNGNGVTGAAGKAAKQLRTWSYNASDDGNAPNYKYPATIVYYKPGSVKPAADVAHIMGTTLVEPLPARITAPKPIVVVLGKTYKGKLAVPAPGSGSGTSQTLKLPSTMSATDEYKPYFAAAKHHTHFRVLYPAVSQVDSFFCPYSEVPPGLGVCSDPSSDPIRSYNIPAAGDGDNSMYAMFGMGDPDNTLGNYWGIEETRFTDAPILQTPNATRKMDGRTYLYFFNAQHIQTIGFVNDGVAYWVQNTLLDGLTNQEMIAIARSLKPV